MKRSIPAVALFFLIGPSLAQAQVGTAFTYQGRLTDAALPASGTYDFEVKLFDALTVGTQVGPTVTLGDIGVANGLFTVSLDFGAAAFTGNKRWLEIGVRPGISTGAYTVLSPRQELTPSPNAVFSATAATAASATNFSGSLAGEVTGAQGASVVSNAVSASTANAIVRRDGSGGFSAGTISLSGNLGLPHTTSTSVGVITKAGARFLHDFGARNIFLGSLAGNTSLSGTDNVGVGESALGATTLGGANTALGAQALMGVTTGNSNIGIGPFAGSGLTTGNGNIYIGNTGSNESDTIRIGSTQVATYLAGSLRLLNSAVTRNTFIGDAAGNTSLSGTDNVAVGSAALGATTLGGANTALGAQALMGVTTGNSNIGIGPFAGSGLTTGNGNIYIGNTGSNESDTIRIGSTQVATYLAGSLRLLNSAVTRNTFIGDAAGNTSLSGTDNVAVGSAALGATTLGGANTALGAQALMGVTSGNFNIGIGPFAGSGLTTGNGNIYIGNTGANESDAIRIGGSQTKAFIAGISGVTVSGGGLSAVVINSLGQLGTAPAVTPANFSGNLAGEVTGTQGATVVSNAVSANTSNAIVRRDGTGSFSAGSASLSQLALPNTASAAVGVVTKGGAPFIHAFGANNTFVGLSAGNFAMSGGANVGIGPNVLQNNTTGDGNTASGSQALATNATGALNAAVGLNALQLNTGGSFNTATGASALLSNTIGINNTATGVSALRSNTTAGQNVAVGVDALRTQSFSNAGGNYDSLNTAVGYQALFSNQPTASTNGVNNTATGANALRNNTTGVGNTAAGSSALRNNTAAGANTAVGIEALQTQSFSNGGTPWNTLNTAVGYRTLFSNQPTLMFNGLENTAVGANALLSNTTGSFNAATGSGALRSNQGGSQNTAMGLDALSGNTVGLNNAAFGVGALQTNTTGNDNTAIGPGADVSVNNLSNATAIGWGAIVNASNKIRLGNTLVTVIEGQVAYTFPSDRTRKENFRKVDAQAVLEKLRQMDVTSWNYIGHDPKEFRHYGPMAQDFYAAFGHDEVGAIGTDTTINSGDIVGILMIGLKGLDAQVQKDQSTIAAQAARIVDLEGQTAEIASLKQQLAGVTEALKALGSGPGITRASQAAGGPGDR